MTPTLARPLRVVQVSFHADTQQRGAEALLDAWPTLWGVAAGAKRANVDVAIVQAAHATRTVQRSSVDFHFVHDTRRVPERIIDQVSSLGADVVHVHGFHHVRAIRRLASACGRTPLLIQDHGSLPPSGWRAKAWQWGLRSTAGVAFTAREQAQPFINAGTLRRDVPIFEVLEGSSTFSPGDQSEAQRTTGLCGDPCVLWVGRLDANKDPLTMLAAIELAAAELPGLRLWCCHGTSPLLEAVQERVAHSPILRERVTLLGTRPWNEMELHFRAADLYVQTSHREGSGYALLEAMACGTPPAVTAIPAARRIIGQVGSLTPVGDARALADSIGQLWSEDAGTARHAVRARFESALTFDAVGRELRAAYEALTQ